MGKIKILMLFLVFNVVTNCAAEELTIRLGTASVGGNYYPLGLSIQEILESYGIHIEVVQTQGSVDNIQKLQNNQLDMAIVQNDIAFFAEHGIYPFDRKVTNMRGIITLYPEPIYIITNKSNQNNVLQVEGQRVNVGQEESGLYIDSRIILNLHSIWETLSITHYPPHESYHLLKNDNVDVAFVNLLPDSMIYDIHSHKLFMLSLTHSAIETLSGTFPYFTNYSKQFNDNSVNTVSVKAILVAKKSLPKETMYKLTKAIYNDFSLMRFPQKNSNEYLKDVLKSMSINKWHNGAQKFYIENGNMSSQVLIKAPWFLLIVIVSLSILIILLNFFMFFLNKRTQLFINEKSFIFRFLKKANLFLINKKYFLVVFIIIVFFLTDLLLVQSIEHEWAIRNNLTSNFDNHSFGDNLVWLFVFSGSGYNDNLFPQSQLGKFLATLIPLIGIGGILTLLGIITSDKIKSKILEAKGVKTKMIKNHIIICGFNKNVPNLIKYLVDSQISKRRNILLLAPLGEIMLVSKYSFDEKIVSYINGTATKREDLFRANLNDADIAVIVADENVSDPDANNILKVLTIEKYCKELEINGSRKNKKNIYTVAEIEDKDNFQLAKDACVDEIVSLEGIRTKIFAQSILNPGVSSFINDILTFNDYNEIYTITLEKGSCLLGMKYDEVLVKLREYNILLLSINIGYKNKSDLLTNGESKRDIITNPTMDVEKNYRIQEGDILIVLAIDGKTIKIAKRNFCKK